MLKFVLSFFETFLTRSSMTRFFSQRTAEEISTATTVIIVVEDAAPEAGRTPLQTERSSLRTRVRKEETRVISGNETTTKRDHAAGVSTAGHHPGQDAAAVHHLHGIPNQGTSLKRGEMRSSEKRVTWLDIQQLLLHLNLSPLS